MKQRDCNFESMPTAELWDLYNELGSELAAMLEAEATLLQRRLDQIERRVRAHPGRDGGTRKHRRGKISQPTPPVR